MEGNKNSTLERLEAMTLPTLDERRKMGNMIIISKFLNQFDIVNSEQFLEIRKERSVKGHNKKQVRKGVKKYSVIIYISFTIFSFYPKRKFLSIDSILEMRNL